MRLLHSTVLLVAFLSTLTGLARADGEFGSDDDIDDPKLERFARHPELGMTSFEDTRFMPSVKFAFRQFNAFNLDAFAGGTNPDGSPVKPTYLTFNTFEFTAYPVSMRYFRVGAEAQLGLGSGQTNSPYTGYFFTTGLDVGFQYPWRVTPFFDARFAGGLLFGEVVGQAALSYIYMYGLDVGVELYVVDRLFVTVSIGWVHPYYEGVDLKWQANHPNSDPKLLPFENDSFTFKIGVGL